VLILKDISSLISKELCAKVAKCITNALLISHGIRRDTILSLYFLSDNIHVNIYGNRVRHIRPDEQSLRGIIRKIYRASMRRGSFTKIHEGIFMERETLLRRIKGYDVVTIHYHKGIDIEYWVDELSKEYYFSSIMFIACVNDSLLEEVNKMFADAKIEYFRITFASILGEAHQLIIVFHNYLDNMLRCSAKRLKNSKQTYK